MADCTEIADEVENTEQTGEESEIVCLTDLLETQEQLLDDANAVLGACDDNNCTYNEGYMKRQALYACLTCTPEARTDATKRAGVCLACCLQCHEGHELIELYTKRNFRCDCGNSKFSNGSCSFEKGKAPLNELNVYGQNFSGVYCTCSRPYPDPEDHVEDDMIQCVVCEDWLHSRHLGVEVPVGLYAEMICESCVKSHEFLMNYQGLFAVKDEEASNVDVETPQVEIPVPSEQIKESDCKMPVRKPGECRSIFFADANWRQQLCTCSGCLKLYEEQKVQFLTDLEDTVLHYEEKGKAKALEAAQSNMDAINALPRVPLMETIAAYNDLKTNLVEYLRKFADNKKVVREEDIREFFSNLESRKKRKTEHSHFCH